MLQWYVTVICYSDNHVVARKLWNDWPRLCRRAGPWYPNIMKYIHLATAIQTMSTSSMYDSVTLYHCNSEHIWNYHVVRGICTAIQRFRTKFWATQNHSVFPCGLENFGSAWSHDISTRCSMTAHGPMGIPLFMNHSLQEVVPLTVRQVALELSAFFGGYNI